MWNPVTKGALIKDRHPTVIWVKKGKRGGIYSSVRRWRPEWAMT